MFFCNFFGCFWGGEVEKTTEALSLTTGRSPTMMYGEGGEYCTQFAVFSSFEPLDDRYSIYMLLNILQHEILQNFHNQSST
jgi:hypothetical protein